MAAAGQQTALEEELYREGNEKLWNILARPQFPENKSVHKRPWKEQF